MNGRRLILVAALAAVAGLVGCTSLRPAGPAAPAVTRYTDRSGQVHLTAEAIALVTHATPYQAETERLRGAEYELTRRCMADRGLAMTGGDDETGLPHTDDGWHPDLATRRIRGYGVWTRTASTIAELPDGYEHALSGSPIARATLRLAAGPEVEFGTDGCLAKGRAGLYGDVFAAMQVWYVPQAAFNQVNADVAADPAMLRAIARWTNCMAGRGHRITDPGAARQAVGAARGSAEQRIRYEREVATDDGECLIKAGVPAVVDRVGARLAFGLPPAQRRELNRTAAIRTAALARAATVLRADSQKG